MKEKNNSTKVKDFFKKIFSKKSNIVVALITVIALIAIIVCIVIFASKKIKEKFALNEIYKVYPDEVKALYSNVVDVSCNGDLHFDIKVDAGEVKLENMNRDDLLTYIFSYMDKNDLLTDKIDNKTFNDTEAKLFDKKLNLINDVNSYPYKEYVYSHDNDKITRKKGECKTTTKNISHLHGYFWDKNLLSVDIDVAYLKEGNLYTFDDKKLGEYNGKDASKLSNLMQEASYYRINFTKDDNNYKLVSIEWKRKS